MPCSQSGSNVLTLPQARQYAASAGFTGQGLEIILAIAQAESGLNTLACNCRNRDGSCDRGIMQINDFAHSEIVDNCAFDPACSFLMAYRISRGGTNFCDWCTYSSQCGNPNCSPDSNAPYRKYLSSSTSTGTPQVSLTPTQVFSKLGLEQWWNEDHDNYFGANGEGGQDYGMHGGFNTPVGAIWGGTVVDILSGNLCGSGNPCGSPDSVGYVVQVLTKDDGLHHYQHLHKIKVNKGDTVQTGTVIGWSGGCGENAYPSTCQYPNPTGFCGCTCYDGCSAGNHIEVRWAPGGYNPQGGFNQGWLNPLHHFVDLSSRQSSSVATNPPPGKVTGTGLGTTILGWTNTHVKLAPSANVDAVLVAIDDLQTVRNPFDLTDAQKNLIGDKISVPGVDISFTDPALYLGDVMINVGSDLLAVVIDVTLILTGIFICWKVINKIVDLASIGKKVEGGIEGGVRTGIQLGALFAA